MVYFIQEKDNPRGCIKIGKTTNLVQRLLVLQRANANILVVLAVLLHEKNDRPYHTRFRLFRHHGEWFFPSDDLMDFIKTLPNTKYTGMTRIPDYVKRARIGGLVRGKQNAESGHIQKIGKSTQFKVGNKIGELTKGVPRTYSPLRPTGRPRKIKPSSL